MADSVLPRARSRKSAQKNPKCPKCGGPLVVERDTPDRTTLKCPKCARRAVGEWLGTGDGYAAVRAAAKAAKALLHRRNTLDDLTQELALALLEHQSPPTPELPEFGEWLTALARTVATGQWREAVGQPGSGDPAVLAETVAEGECDEPAFEFAADAERFYKARAARVRRALGKLSKPQADAVRAKFFRNKPLSAVAAAGGKCDSAERMNLLRAKRRLAELIDSSGYALAA